jgi:glucose-1-phosphate cytidylyltransferase
MKTIILAGGLGTRLQEETSLRPKPMVEIGGKPILWHILKHYSQADFNEFYIALGYMGDFIKSYFVERLNLSGTLTLDFSRRTMKRSDVEQEAWQLNLVETGLKTNTGGRLLRLRRWIGQETFMLTYGDGVSNVDLHELVACHRRSGRLATITAVRPPARFGGLNLDGEKVESFNEKPVAGEGWINGGFMVLEPGVFDYLGDDDTSFERDVLEKLAADGELTAHRHGDFWQCMDTLRDKQYLERLWHEGNAPWRTWDEAPAAVPFPGTKAA